MPAGHGLRSRTRDLFARGFRKKGTIHLSTYLRTYHAGDYVDVKVNGAIHKGMPQKFYHFTPSFLPNPPLATPIRLPNTIPLPAPFSHFPFTVSDDDNGGSDEFET